MHSNIYVILKFCELEVLFEQTEQLNFNHFIESRMCGINSSVSTQRTHTNGLHKKQNTLFNDQ